MAGFESLPLCLPLSGVLKGRVYTFQWSCMLILLYFAEAGDAFVRPYARRTVVCDGGGGAQFAVFRFLSCCM